MDTFLDGNRVAMVKVAQLILGVINIGFIGHSYRHYSSLEEAYLSAVIICFIISFLWTMAIIVGLIKQESEELKKADMLFHCCACVFYLITLILFLVALTENGKPLLWERIVSLLLGIALTILYGLGGYMFYKL